jgi:serine/threonine protein kinase
MPLAQQLGRYQLLDRIAFGGMAEIFRAKTFDHEGRVHLVAVKRVLNHLIADEDFMRMLVDEARITALLQHENIARVYEFAKDVSADGEEEYFIAMEYVDGKDVRTLLDRQRGIQNPIPPEHVAWIGMEIANALHAAHTQKDAEGRGLHIVHRDVSPSNVLLSYRGEIKLCDFGIAKATTTRVQTKTGVIKGKVKYMSPEQAMGRKLDHRSDLFSLGTVLYEMATLSAPFIAATEVELIFAVRDARKRPARELEPTVPEELEQILDKLMARSRSQRYQSGAELALALRRFLDRHRPGYRRSNFGRYMRAMFETDIERELRLLEEYVIDGGDPSKVGENLIADALGVNAPYTKFTAVIEGEAGESREAPPSPASSTLDIGRMDTAAPRVDLHAEKTQILNRALRRPDLHAEKTQILDRAALGLPPARSDRTTTPRALPPLHGEKTHILERSVISEDDETAPLHAEKTRILERSPQLASLADDHEPRTQTMHGNENPMVTERQPRVILEDDESPTSDLQPRIRRDTPIGFGEGPDESTRVPNGDDGDDS